MKSRASDAMWIFGTAISAVVGVMVIAGVVYQVHLDRVAKKKKEYQNRGRHFSLGDIFLLNLPERSSVCGFNL